MMRFGYGLITCQRYPGDPRGDADLYQEALGAAEEAERLGFDSVWTSEHHFADDSYAPSLLTLSAAMAARTSRIQVGTGLVLAPLHHPIRLAEDAAVVDLISGGRLILGVGQGWLRWEFEALGASFTRRGRGIQEAIETCRQAWGDGLVEAAGVAVLPKPARSGGPPIWVGAESEPAIRRAAALADGWLAGEPDPGTFRVQMEWLADEMRRRAGRLTRCTWRATGPCSWGTTLIVPGRWCGHFTATFSGSTWTPNARRGGSARFRCPRLWTRLRRQRCARKSSVAPRPTWPPASPNLRKSPGLPDPISPSSRACITRAWTPGSYAQRPACSPRRSSPLCGRECPAVVRAIVAREVYRL